MNQLQRSADQEGVFSSAMDISSSLAQDWIQPATDFNNLTSLGFDSMFQFNGQTDSFPIDHAEFATTDFGFPSGMTGPIPIFDSATTGHANHVSNSNNTLSNGNISHLGGNPVDNILLEPSGGSVNLSLALKPHYIKSLKASAATK
ncbi:hypothetical protein BGZ65_011680, partial [Modicella reniformis]